MQYDIRKGHYPTIEGEGLMKVMNEEFGNVKQDGGKLVSSYGAITKVEVKVLSKSAIDVTSVTDKAAPMDVQLDTIKHWNLFLERVTGYNSKERGKRLQKKAKEGK